MDTLNFYFHFGQREYSVTLNIILGSVPLIISHKALHELSLKYQTYHKTIYRLEDGYKEKVEMGDYLPYTVFFYLWLPFNDTVEEYSAQSWASFSGEANECD